MSRRPIPPREARTGRFTRRPRRPATRKLGCPHCGENLGTCEFCGGPNEHLGGFAGGGVATGCTNDHSDSLTMPGETTWGSW